MRATRCKDCEGLGHLLAGRYVPDIDFNLAGMAVFSFRRHVGNGEQSVLYHVTTTDYLRLEQTDALVWQGLLIIIGVS